MSTEQINYEAAVRDVYPESVSKHWAYDNGSGVTSFWMVSQFDSNVYDEKYTIGNGGKSSIKSWQSAYNTLKQQGKIK